MKDNFIFICAGFVGVFLGFCVFGFLGDLLFSHWAESGSVTFGNWAMWTGAFFTAVAAGAAIYAAFGAVRTLNFLKDQDAATRAHDQKRFEHDEAIWSEQRVMLKFQQFREHKADFDLMLSKLEATHSIRFKDRLSLYKKIFPQNSHSNTAYQVLLEEPNGSHLPKIKDSMEHIAESLSQFSVPTSFDHDLYKELLVQCEKHLVQLSSLLGDLDIALEINNSYGDLYVNTNSSQERYVLLNIFDSLQTLYSLWNVVEGILDFCGCKLTVPKVIGDYWGYQYAIAYYGIVEKNGLARTHGHAFNRNLGTLFDYYKITMSPEYSSNPHLKVFREQFAKFIRNPDLSHASTTHCQEILDILEKAISSTIRFNKDHANEVFVFSEFLTVFSNQTKLLRENADADIDF